MYASNKTRPHEDKSQAKGMVLLKILLYYYEVHVSVRVFPLILSLGDPTTLFFTGT